ncbi:Ig-like domain-containing protein [Diaminobutyricibacter sp. McL0618]|uniref:Ig-like domain-containing protein n=1 Tax=Leifsonia sp. McL0618 TaxID=3415677 RepID=UPI003CF5EF7D
MVHVIGSARRSFVAAIVLTLILTSTVAANSARAATLTLPDLRILVPTNLMSIAVDPVTHHRMLRYTHITEDAGTGPFEIDPTYDPATGLSTFVQTIYNSSSPGVWSVDHRVPVAVNGAFVNGSDYRFPLTKFTLNHLNSNGSIGAVAATSSKTDYCITGDNRVGDVPNTPTQTFIPASNCTDPAKPLGWSVGWGDQYDQTDAGQPIDINALLDGAYVLKATVDPEHVLTESNNTNNVTTTVLTIKGTAVTVGAQSRPVTVPPSISLTSPAPSSTVSGTAHLSASASAVAPAVVASVQYLLDGNHLGPALTTTPFAYSWTTGSTSPGRHTLSAQVTDSAGNMSTAAVVPVTVAASGSPPGFAVDQTVSATGRGTVATAAFSAHSPGEVFVAFVGSDGPASAGAQTATVSGGGLSWRRVSRADAQFGDSEIWTATSSGSPAGVVVTSTPSQTGFDQQLSVLTFAGASGVGASANASAGSGAPNVSVVASKAGSLVYGVGNDWDTATPRTPGVGQTLVAQWADTATGDTFWAQGLTSASSTIGKSVSIGDTAPTTDRWNLAAIEVVPGSVPATPDTTPPTVSITNPAPGQTVSGTTPVAAAASDNVALASVQFLLDGQPLSTPLTSAPYALQWNTTVASAGSHTLSATATDTSGNRGTATPVTVTVQNPAPPMTCFVMQVQRSIHGTGPVSAPAFNTAMPGELLVAFVASDGPASAGAQTATVGGAGLTWTLVKRANARYGDSEIWTATASAILTNATVTSTPSAAGFDQSLTVIAMEGTSGIGASMATSAATGAAAAALTTVSATSLVFAVANDWDNAAARTFPSGFVPLDQWTDTRTGDTMWSEYTNQPTGAAGSIVRIGTSSPSTDQWNMVAVELKNDGS